MTELVFFLEEPSAREMLKGVLPKFLPTQVSYKFVVFQGKQDLEKRLPIRLKAWLQTDVKFIVMRDQDSGDCEAIKNNLMQKCADSGKPNCLVRIACHELESFYLGDLAAVAQAIGPGKIVKQQTKAKFRDPDQLNNAAQELKKLVPEYQKVAGSRAIGPYMNIEKNSSTSFNALISGVKRLLASD